MDAREILKKYGLPSLADANLAEVDLKHAYLAGADLRWTNFTGADLSGADFTGADLSGASLYGADLKGAIFKGASLRYASLRKADLTRASLDGANLNSADLLGACLSGASLIKANLWEACLARADLQGVVVSIDTIGYFSWPPQEGSYIAYKKCFGCIAKGVVPETAKRSSATTNKCRASEWETLGFYNLDGTPCANRTQATSLRSHKFFYIIGEKSFPHYWEENRWEECAGGIHHFLSFEEAAVYQ